MAASMIELMDGKRTLQEIAESAAAKHGTTFDQAAPGLLSYLHHLIDHIGIATADVTRCGNCPARKAHGD